jgi:hypothetical protein
MNVYGIIPVELHLTTDTPVDECLHLNVTVLYKGKKEAKISLSTP